MLRHLLRGVDLPAATVAGLAAGAVYIATMEIDNRLTGQDIDDLKLLGRPFVKGPEHAKLAGIPVHFNNAVALAVAYAAVGRKLPGPAWLKGIAFANIENTLLYPLTLLEHHHPGIRNGEIDRYFSLKAYLQSIPRHVTYGAAVAELYARLARNP